MSYMNVLERLYQARLSPSEFDKQLKIHFGHNVAILGSPDSKNKDLFHPVIDDGVVVSGKFYNE